jgi:RAD51-like protein 2
VGAADVLAAASLVALTHDTAALLPPALAAAVAALPALCDRHPAVKLVVIDSIAFLARGAPGGTATKRAERALAATAAALAALARDRSLAVVLTNQVTTRVTAGEGARLVPALGVGWAHAPTTRVLLRWRAGARVACLVKSPALPAGRAAYVVTGDGVRGVGRKRDRG